MTYNAPITNAADLKTFLQFLEPPHLPESALPVPKARLKYSMGDGSLTWGPAGPHTISDPHPVFLAVQAKLHSASNIIAALPSEEARTTLVAALKKIHAMMLGRLENYHTRNNTLFNCCYRYRRAPLITQLFNNLNSTMQELIAKASKLPVVAAPPPPPVAGLKGFKPAALLKAAAEPAPAPASLPAPIAAAAKKGQFAMDTNALKGISLRKRAASITAPPPPSTEPEEADDTTLSAKERALKMLTRKQ